MYPLCYSILFYYCTFVDNIRIHNCNLIFSNSITFFKPKLILGSQDLPFFKPVTMHTYTHSILQLFFGDVQSSVHFLLSIEYLIQHHFCLLQQVLILSLRSHPSITSMASAIPYGINMYGEFNFTLLWFVAELQNYNA